MYGMSVQQALLSYTNTFITGMRSYTKLNEASSFSETLSKVEAAKTSGKKRIQPEQSTVDKYISKHSDRKADVEKMVTATSSELNTISTKLSGVVDSLSSSTIEALKSLGENQSAELQELASKYDVLAEKLVTQNATYAENVNKLMTEQFAAVEAKNAESLEKMVALKDSYQTACTDLLNKSTEANEQIISEFKGSFGTFVQELQASMASQCSILSKSIADNVKTLDSSYSFMKEHLAEMVANYEQSAEAFKDAVNVAHRTNESSENAIAKVTDALENMKTTNETLEKVIETVATKQANVDKIVANIKEMNSTIEALQQLESVLNRIAKK